jgi:hypothetical protein
MKNKYVSLFLATALGLSLLTSTPTHAASLSDLGDINLTQFKGYDEVSELNGQKFACTSAVDNQSKNLRQVFESTVDEIGKQRSNWQETNGNFPESGTATWTPVQPPALKCSFSSTLLETNKTQTAPVTTALYGAGTLDTTCDTNRTTNVEFTFNAIIPTTFDVTRGILPNTSASDWKVTFAGFRNCAWSLSFNSGAHTLSGTVEQDLTTLDSSAPAISFNCNDFSKTICIQYTLATNVFAVGGTGDFVSAAGTGSQIETRTLPAFLIDMPFEVDGENATKIASVRSNKKPKLQSVSTAAVKKNSSKLTLKLKKTARPTVRLASPPSINGVITLGKGPNGQALKMKIASAPKSSCSVTGKSGKKKVQLVKRTKVTNGVLKTSLTSASLARILRTSVGQTVSVTISCLIGAKTATAKRSIVLA